MNSRFPFQLSGLVACGTCGGRMPGKSAHGKKLKIPYYAHGWTTVRAAVNDDAKHRCTGPERILANIVEPLVWEKVVNLLSDPFHAKRIVDEAKRLHGQKGRAQDLERLTSKISQIDSQTEALAEHLANIPKGVSPTPIFNQMKKLEETKDMLRAELGEVERTLDESAMPVDLAGYEEFLAALKRGLNTVGEAAKAEIIQKVVSKVEIYPESATVYYRVSKGETRPPEVAPLGEPKTTSQSPEAGEGQKVETPTFFKNRGSTTCFFGGGYAKVYEPRVEYICGSHQWKKTKIRND